MTSKMPPAAFLSYSRADDDAARGAISALREALELEVRLATGTNFVIFQDRKDIAWGQSWKQRIEETLDATTLLIPILTPAFFTSPHCREESNRFLDRERRLGRSDLVLPVYYVDAPQMNEGAARTADPLASTLAERQYVDWRHLRIHETSDSVVREQLKQLGERIRDAIFTSVSATRVGGQTRAEPSSHIVDPAGHGHFTRIGDAIAATEEGGRVLIRPGLYEEALVIDKPIEIVGDGPVDDIVIRARETAVVSFKTSFGRVSNVTLRQAGGGAAFGVDIAQGRLELEACEISSASLSCVAIRAGADPRLRRNVVHGAPESGVLVLADGLGTLEDNEIWGNRRAGVEISDGGDPTLRRNVIRDGRGPGVLIRASGRGTLEDNEIRANAQHGVEIRSGADPTLRRNRIHQGGQCGVLVHQEGIGLLEDNEIFDNAFAGVQIQTQGNPTVRRNHIHHGKTTGILVVGGGRGIVEENTIVANGKPGIEITTEGDPVIRRNAVCDGADNGIMVQQDGRGRIEDNDISGNAYAGVQIQEGGDPVLQRNRIHDGQTTGVLIRGNGRGTLEDNDIFANAYTGVEIRTGADPVVRSNRIRDGAKGGVIIRKGGAGTIEDNDIFGNAGAGVEITGGANPTVVRNRIHDNAYGLLAHDHPSGRVVDNDLTGNRTGAWQLDEHTDSALERRDNRT